MSNPHSTATQGSGHGSGGGDHHPHVLPVSTYIAVFVTLLILTVITVAASRVDLGNANLLIALSIATVKALCVSLIFMHLLFDKKFNAIVFASSLIFLAVFIGFTMADTGFRGHDGRTSSDGPVDVQNPFGGTRSSMAVQMMYEKPKPGALEVKPMDMPLGVKQDINLYVPTPTPAGDTTTVDVPAVSMAPGAPHKAETEHKAE
jgi:cytochrome c oxidase subunit 4